MLSAWLFCTTHHHGEDSFCSLPVWQPPAQPLCRYRAVCGVKRIRRADFRRIHFLWALLAGRPRMIRSFYGRGWLKVVWIAVQSPCAGKCQTTTNLAAPASSKAVFSWPRLIWAILCMLKCKICSRTAGIFTALWWAMRSAAWAKRALSLKLALP